MYILNLEISSQMHPCFLDASKTPCSYRTCLSESIPLYHSSSSILLLIIHNTHLPMKEVRIQPPHNLPPQTGFHPVKLTTLRPRHHIPDNLSPTEPAQQRDLADHSPSIRLLWQKCLIGRQELDAFRSGYLSAELAVGFLVLCCATQAGDSGR